jgi:MoaA/NifB/PqqE/SkfB family radical SAM enzyme/protein-L-isoaspartate O-methyltransferase
MKGNDLFARIAASPSMSAMHPRIAEFFNGYLRGEKAVAFGNQWVINTHFPPVPSLAFDGLIAQIQETSGRQRLYSVTMAVTNRCHLKCWHCYNAGRDQHDIPLPVIRDLAAKLQDQGAIMIDLTGGEPLLRPDLEEICSSFDARSCVIVGTTGNGLTPERAKSLRSSGVFGVGISLDSMDEHEHDRLRGRKGAFQTATQALSVAAGAGLYPYIVSVSTREFIQPAHFYPFMDLAKKLGALEVHLLEPCPTGRLAGHAEVALTSAEREQIIRYQHEVASRDDLPILSTFTYLEGPDAFGCGAGLTHLYIDGSGELCPCNLVPISFGNIAREPLETVLDRMRQYFRQPRTTCVGRTLTRHVQSDVIPTPPDISCALCEKYLPQEHDVPKFFSIRNQTLEAAGTVELTDAYNHVYESYDDFWTVKAGGPTTELIERLDWHGSEKVLEAGCGSGFATAQLAQRLSKGGSILAVDISEGMQKIARRRLQALSLSNVEFKCGDALQTLFSTRDLDLVFSSWVLGYIPVPPFMAAADQSLKIGGRLAFLVHKENSPQREFGLFTQLVAREPSVLTKQIAFGFPRDAVHVREQLQATRLEPVDIWEGHCIFHYETAEQVFEHLLKSGAGTVFYEAVVESRRKELTVEFISLLKKTVEPGKGFDVVHDYVACIAKKS